MSAEGGKERAGGRASGGVDLGQREGATRSGRRAALTQAGGRASALTMS